MEGSRVEINIGDIIGSNIGHIGDNNFCDNSCNITNNKIGTSLNCSYIMELIRALDMIDKTSDNIKTKKDILDIRKQLNSNEPNVGIIRAAFNNLKRICTNENFLKAVDVFGNLLLKAIK